MKRREKIELILIFRKSIDMLDKQRIIYICGTVHMMKYSDEFEGKFKAEDLDLALEYLYSEIPTSTYNRTFYDHRLFNRTNPYYLDKDDSSKVWPWWILTKDMQDIYDIEKEDQYLDDMRECREQRILFLRILIDKLNK